MRSLRRPAPVSLDRVEQAVARLELPDVVFKTCPWRPREPIERGLRQWLRCAGAALRDDQVIGMPSRAVDEAWHGFILCTARYAGFCETAYGRFLHHHPDGAEPPGGATTDSIGERLGRTVVSWAIVAAPDERCELWDLDARVGVAEPWGVPQARVEELLARLPNRDE